MKKNTWRLLIALLLMVGSVNICLAQDPPDDPSPTDPADIPIDGGLSLLLAAGAVYGGRRLHHSVQANKNDESKGCISSQERIPLVPGKPFSQDKNNNK